METLETCGDSRDPSGVSRDPVETLETTGDSRDPSGDSRDHWRLVMETNRDLVETNGD